MGEGHVTVGHPVDVGSGAIFTLSDDFLVPGSIELRWRRHYSTVAACDRWLGVKWTVPYFMSLERRADSYVLSGAHGEEITFISPAGRLRDAFVVNLSANMELRREKYHYCILHWHAGGHINRFYFPAIDEKRLPLAWIDNLAGHRVRVDYDTMGRPIRLMQELESRTMEISYDRSDLISAIYFLGKADRKLLVRYEYDSARRLIAAVNAMGHSKGYEYDGENRLIAETSPSGSRFVFDYDALGRCTRTAGADGYTERKLQYLATPRMTRVTDSRGAVTEYLLNLAGQVVQIVHPLGGVTTNTFDENGRLASVTHPDGATENFVYDDSGNCVATEDCCGAKTVVEYDDLHVPIMLVDRNGNAWKLPDACRGSLIGVENLPRQLWDYNWDARGLVARATSPGGWVFEIRRDLNFSWQEIRDQISIVTLTDYDEFGYATRVLDDEGLVSRTRYDDLHRPVEITRGASEVKRFKWNAVDKMTERYGPGDQHEIWRYDQYGYLLEHTDSMGATVRYEYDKEGKLTAITNRVGERLEYTRDIRGRVIEEKLFDGRIQRYEYDLSGRQVRICLSDGRTVDQRFDAAGRLVCRQASDGLVEEFAYDNAGRVVKAWNNNTVVELKRNRFGRILYEVQNKYRVYYAYDADGNRVGRSLPFATAGSNSKRVLDVRGRLLELCDERGTCQKLNWDNTNRLVERRFSSGVVEHFTYDTERHLYQQRVRARDGHFVRAYLYDPNNNIRVFEDDREGINYLNYDQLDRLREVRRERSVGRTGETYEYDANHAIRASHRGLRSVGAGGKVLQDGLRHVTYGNDGAVAAIRSGPSTWTFRHDVNRRLVEATKPDGTAIQYEYDPFGRRLAKVVGGERTEFLWDGWTLAAEVRDHVAVDIYVCADLRPLAQWKGGRRLTPILDARGAVLDVFDEFGERRWNCTLDAYGNLLSEEGDLPNPFRLRGQYHDTETGLYYNFHRHYDPRLGDYTAPDPIGVSGGYNLYAYPRNPFRWDDPFGLKCGDPEKHKDDPSGTDATNSKPQTGPEPVSPEEPAPPGQPAAKGGPYSDLEDPPGVGPGQKFTPEQKEEILAANRARNGGVLTSDISGKPLDEPTQCKGGVPKNMNEAEVDHIIPRNPKDPNVAPGTNSYSNAQVASAAENKAKLNK